MSTVRAMLEKQSDHLEHLVLDVGHDGPGRKWVLIECPCCGREVLCYVWSLAGSGKRCKCGALHYTGLTKPAKDDPGPWGAAP
jgi:hypothetical protein